jgi:S-formylglutathione hydrolase FrmB
VQNALIDKWKAGQVATDTKVDARMNEILHNGNPQPAAQTTPDMTQGDAAMGMSMGGMNG